MIVVCKKDYMGLVVNNITRILPRRRDSIIDPSQEEVAGLYPVGGIRLLCDEYSFISYNDFIVHFCTEREYRKLKLEKINERQGNL